MIRVGIFFGGASREREVSFSGGRTVYDNLDKSVFEPVPLFVDSFNNIILLHTHLIYKGSIRDFYPPVQYIPASAYGFQAYIESLENELKSGRISADEMISQIGRHVAVDELPQLIDLAFLALHGSFGEDGTIQGLLEWLKIPYTGSGILPSAIGISKSIQKQLLADSKFGTPPYTIIHRKDWENGDQNAIINGIKSTLKFPVVVKSANQGSSIGVSVINEFDLEKLSTAINKSLFDVTIKATDWQAMDKRQRIDFVRDICDIREGLGLPLLLDGQALYLPDEVFSVLSQNLEKQTTVRLQALQTEHEVVVEEFIHGREFSCIVIRGLDGKPVALPPTEIVKAKEFFDYRAKYLPGLSRKITPIHLPEAQIEAIRQKAQDLYSYFRFNTYARLDGFITAEGHIFLNDPNTTSGMMPSSFFFHQAAEIGLNPSQFLTYIIYTSLVERLENAIDKSSYQQVFNSLNTTLQESAGHSREKKKIAVIMGGYSSERHISMESGRNIYEKLASSVKYEPVPVFLTGSVADIQLYRLPINMMLKDNADDIAEKIRNYSPNAYLQKIIDECAPVLEKFGRGGRFDNKPERVSFQQLAHMVQGVFIALHGRPGEDGTIQKHLEAVGLPYNGSGIESSSITINKYDTAELLQKHGFSVARHILIYKDKWQKEPDAVIGNIEQSIGYPLIAKPADDGCSSAVKKIKTRQQLDAFLHLMFRDEERRNPEYEKILGLLPNEEFPRKEFFLIEKFVDKEDAKIFLEVTGGLLTHRRDDGSIDYEMFEPSETLAEKEILSLEEKFLAGQGQNITPARYAPDAAENKRINEAVKAELKKVAQLLKIEGYARIDAFVKVHNDDRVEVIFIEVNSLPGMTPATCIFHQSALSGYMPYDFIDAILEYGFTKRKAATA